MAVISAILVILSAVYLSRAQEGQPSCYWRSDSSTSVYNSPDDWFPCNNTEQVPGGAQLCCLPGAQCGTNAICRLSSSRGGSGWFVGGCTDPTYEDPVCRTSCTGDLATFIQYNYTSQLWHCCGDDGCSGTPTSETFQASPPEQFSAAPSGAQSSAASSTAPTVTVTPSSSATDELTTGAKAGIGIAAAAAGVAVAAAIVFFILWRKAHRRGSPDQSHIPLESPDEKWRQELGLHHQQQQQQQSAYAHYGSQPARSYPRLPEEMPAGQARTPELAGEGATRSPK